MNETSRCAATTSSGGPCQMAPQAGSQFCWVHDPDKAEERAEARRLGGLNRRRRKRSEKPVSHLSLRTPDAVLRLLETAALDTLCLENSIARSRALAYLSGQALQAIEASDLEARLSQLEERLANR